MSLKDHIFIVVRKGDWTSLLPLAEELLNGQTTLIVEVTEQVTDQSHGITVSLPALYGLRGLQRLGNPGLKL